MLINYIDFKVYFKKLNRYLKEEIFNLSYNDSKAFYYQITKLLEEKFGKENFFNLISIFEDFKINSQKR